MGGDLITVKSDPLYVLLSIVISFFGSYASITVFEQYRLCIYLSSKPKLYPPWALLVLMALCLGGVAIWAMHFVGMSSVQLISPNGEILPVRYRVDLTVGSLVIVVVVCFIGLLISAADKDFAKDRIDAIDEFMQENLQHSITQIQNSNTKFGFLTRSLFHNLLPLVIGGTFTALGVCVMHFTGMQGLAFEGRITWDQGIIAASVIIALVASIAANWILFRLLSIFPYHDTLRVASAAIMAVAVNGMHYTGMAAAKYHYVEGAWEHSTVPVVSQSTATLGAITAATLFLWIAFLLILQDVRTWYYDLARVVREADRRLVVHAADPSTSSHPFMLEYRELRSATATNKALINMRLKRSGSGVFSHSGDSPMKSVSVNHALNVSKFAVGGAYMVSPNIRESGMEDPRWGDAAAAGEDSIDSFKIFRCNRESEADELDERESVDFQVRTGDARVQSFHMFGASTKSSAVVPTDDNCEQEAAEYAMEMG